MISFFLKIGSVSAPCKYDDANEEVVLEYSLNNGGSYTRLGIYDVTGTYDNFTSVVVPIAPTFQKQQVVLRLRQLNHNSLTGDNWAIDNFGMDVSSLTSAPAPRDA